MLIKKIFLFTTFLLYVNVCFSHTLGDYHFLGIEKFMRCEGELGVTYLKLEKKWFKSARVFQKEDGIWKRVRDSELAKPLNDGATHIVYTLGCENKQIDMNGITFSDYFETDHQELLLKQQDEFDFTGIDDGDYNVYREQKQLDRLNGKLTQSGFYSTLQ